MTPSPPLRPAPTSTTDDVVNTIIPAKNPQALTAYYLGVFSIIPCAGLFMGIAALVLGIRGLRAVKANPQVKGTVHAWIGIVAGGLCAALNLLGVALMVLSTVMASKQP